MADKKIKFEGMPDMSKIDPHNVEVILNIDLYVLEALWANLVLALHHPSNANKDNPTANITRLFVRDLGRMLMDSKMITEEQYETAITEPDEKELEKEEKVIIGEPFSDK